MISSISSLTCRRERHKNDTNVESDASKTVETVEQWNRSKVVRIHGHNKKGDAVEA
jgi:hypothetical protein